MQDSDMDSVDEPLQGLEWKREQPFSTIVSANKTKEEEEPVYHIQWKSVPATPVFQWKRIPSTRVMIPATIKEREEEPVQHIMWERIPVSPTLDIKWERVLVTPTLDIKWERIASSRAIPKMPKDVKLEQEIHWYREPARTPAVQWERVIAPASPQQCNKPILKSALKFALKKKESSTKPKSAMKSYGFSSMER